MNNTPRIHGEGIILRNRNESDVSKIITLIKNEWHNPFNLNESPQNLINICTGRIASEDIQKSLSNFVEKAKLKSDGFVTSVIINGSKSFWEPIKKEKVLTFTGFKIKQSEVMFRRIVAAAKFQILDLNNILSYELTSVPFSLFHEDGSMRKSNKSDLATKLVPLEQSTSCEKINSVLIDGMVLIQEINEKCFTTFNELALFFSETFFQ